MASLPDSIGQLANLTRLSLEGNQLTSVPESIGQLTNLTTLSLEGNPLPIGLLDAVRNGGVDGWRRWFENNRPPGTPSDDAASQPGDSTLSAGF